MDKEPNKLCWGRLLGKVIRSGKLWHYVPPEEGSPLKHPFAVLVSSSAYLTRSMACSKTVVTTVVFLN
ncbi:uncharacterized protein GLRG_02343 [Colletotrichum graminicola M1.001]|uniref:Uncharacterized protein n=1 Tax=Colletotrichum graminicola (strain M1.001 / M2 / FGSC 10212) TaxID=645133 RepID=E3Q8G0_COLGM|nr:uncharacterized protein GLRG_02343 [Colletotrichum graminicola M1.001]EFQ27172.1 hypothetical protein GLRG_02343 [Colletotrichum graminicola M1.001]